MGERYYDNTDLGDVSGGNPVNTAGQNTAVFEDLLTGEGGALAFMFGEHVGAGHLLGKYAPNITDLRFLVALGDGADFGWEGAVNVWYAGEQLNTVSLTDGNTAGYHFRRGILSSGNSDPDQGLDTYFTSLTGIQTYSGTSYIAVRLPEIFATEERPDKLRGRYKGLRIPDWDVSGNQTATGTYSTNPARIAAYAIWRAYRRTFEGRLPTATIDALFKGRIHWPSWVRWRDYCDALLIWNYDGVSSTLSKRFEAHPLFLADATAVDILKVCCGLSATFWQDDGAMLRFVLPTDTTPVHHFNESNVVEDTFNLAPKELRTVPRYFKATFRNLDDTYLSEGVVEWRNADLVKRFGLGKPVERVYPNMRYTQAQRLIAFQGRLESNPNLATFTGRGDAFHVLKGDYVTVSWGEAGWDYAKCLVVATEVQPAERTDDQVIFTVQRVSGNLYSDGDHYAWQPTV